MHTESREPRAVTGTKLERAIVLQLLRDDRGQEEWSSQQLAAEMDMQPPMLERALENLERDGVLSREQDVVGASRATCRLDELGLLSV